MRMGRGPPKTSALALFMQNAFLSRPGKSLGPASETGNLGIAAVARQMRRLFGPFGGAFRQDVLAATDAGASSNVEYSAALVAHGKAKKTKGDKDGDGET